MKITDIKEYELLEERELKDIYSTGSLLHHKKSGARIVLISNSDDNKVFTIGFRTPPEDSTGLPHILEHSVLCGSKNYPVKDPFVELAKGSMNTFLNAMTYPDKTVYPIASCNEKDFQNLMNIYMDAVLYPNIYKNKEIFQQEGWHYEMEGPDSELKLNGVVYNEMKGAFSSADSMLDRTILNSLFPENAYGHESGGAPEAIPDLTYEQFLDFHKKYYHPTNSYIYLYGDMDMAEKLIWLDKEYLSQYDVLQIDSHIDKQSSFSSMKEVTKKYPVTEEEPLMDNTFLSWNKVISTSLDRNLYYAFQVLEYALLSAPGAPLKQALLDARIGKDIMGYYDNGILQPYFSIIAKNSDIEKKEEFLEIITNVLEKCVKDGLDKKALEAGINCFEFKFREADFGNYPKGLMYGLQMFDSWLYEDSNPFMHMEALEVFAFLKEQLDTDYYTNLISTWLLDNEHGCYVTLVPERGLTAKQDKELVKKLASYKEELSPEEIEKIVSDTRHLKEYQKEPSAPEELATIPVLNVSDLRREVAPIYNTEHFISDTKILHHNINTNGIAYLSVLFDTDHIQEPLLPYLGILKMVLGYIDTKKYTYGDLFNEINRNSGGISNSYKIFSNVVETDSYRTMFGLQAKVLYDKIPFAFEMIEEIIFNSKLEDEKRLYEIIGELKSKLQMHMVSAGHSTALNRAMSYFSPTAYLSDLTDGIALYDLLSEIEKDFEGHKEELIANLKQLVEHIFTRENLFIDYTADEQGYKELEKEAAAFLSKLPSCIEDKKKPLLTLQKKNEGIKTASQIQYVARCGNFMKNGFPFTGSMRVLRNMMSYEYLWNQVRVMGGAYGCMNGFGRMGDSFFVSYRDPNLEKTMKVYEQAPDYIRSSQLDERSLTKYIIGAISDMDTPLNPLAKGRRSLAIYMNGQTLEDLQKERDEVLDTTKEDIHRLADTVQSVLDGDYICVIGNEEKIEEQKELFMNIRSIG